jgi:predicted dehydrogenase
MLAEHELDIVLIGTPDHWHALPAIAALEAGANLYLQKPVGVDVRECEAILDTARRLERTVQIGTQRRSTPHLIDAKRDIVEAGLLGQIGHVELCCYYHMRFNDNPAVREVPAHFDYDFWSGPAPVRPFDGLPHRRWRSYEIYGNGIMGDMCVHMLDTVRWLLELGWPKSIESTGGTFVQTASNATIPDTQTAIFRYPYFDCVWNHRTWGTPVDPEFPWAFKIYGEKGTLAGDVRQWRFTPVDKQQPTLNGTVLYERESYPEDLTEKDIELHTAPATRRQLLDLLTAIETKSRPVADIEEGYISSASCILANVALEVGRPLSYDPLQRQVIADQVASNLLARPYRSAWQHPAKG